MQSPYELLYCSHQYGSVDCPGKFLYDRMGDVAKKVNMLIEKTPKDDGLDSETKSDIEKLN